MLIVQKFGGSSVADTEKIRRVAGIITKTKDGGDMPVVVLSARGDTTDILIDDAKELNPAPSDREMDALLSTGELTSAALMAMQLQGMGYDCVSLSGRQAGIYTDANHGSALIENINTRRMLREIGQDRIVIVAGFQGIDRYGDITTLGRGGSDTTAVALAAALHAGKCEIYSDVDGIYSADPRLVTGAVRLPVIDRHDMLLLARGGSQVLHSRSVEAAIEYGVDVHLLSSYGSARSTLMTDVADKSTLPPVTGITRNKAESLLSVVGPGVTQGTLTETVSVLCENNIQILEAALGDGLCTVRVEPECVMPALELTHRHFFG